MDQERTDVLGTEYPGRDPDPGDAGMGVREERPDPHPSVPGACQNEADGPTGEEPTTRPPQPENHPE